MSFISRTPFNLKEHFASLLIIHRCRKLDLIKQVVKPTVDSGSLAPFSSIQTSFLLCRNSKDIDSIITKASNKKYQPGKKS